MAVVGGINGVGTMSAIGGIHKLNLPVSTAGAVDISVFTRPCNSGKSSRAMFILFSCFSWPRKRKESAICPENSEKSSEEITGMKVGGIP